ncbi:Endonuclease/Exonuclease/phosphatase family [Rhizoctonia solani]|uniref:Endonuclease/Exonuclease/phosphatase family n=1 Tax=Rhizoctonia solani TaxID=456999 RepID=A0A8H7H4U1_9AGAM|nr:Endonuclease/Exonuclease/phosphatase family [Rhizoctonia solani]
MRQISAAGIRALARDTCATQVTSLVVVARNFRRVQSQEENRILQCKVIDTKPVNGIQKAAATVLSQPAHVDLPLSSSIPTATTMLFQATSFLALLAAVYAQAPQINTPAAVVQCQPAQISFIATNTPVFISIIPGGQPSAAPLADLGQQNASPFTWIANIAQGTSVTFQIRDSTGAVAYSAPITIQGSSDSSCLGQQPSTSAGSATAAPTTSAPATSSAASSVSSAVSSVSSSLSSVASSVASSVSSAISTATAPATTSRTATVVSPSSTPSGTASGAAPSGTANGAVPAAKAGLVGLLGVAAAAVVMA